MSQLIQMCNRIKAIETIRKITHAMRLISMSMHSRLKTKQEGMKLYTHEVVSLFKKIHAQTSDWSNDILYPLGKLQKHLIIVIGSQKGLCGNFNSALFRLLDKELKDKDPSLYCIIPVGKKAVDFVMKKNIGTVLETHSQFSLTSLGAITKSLANEIVKNQPYATVTFFSNELQNFFHQKPYKKNLIPFSSVEKLSLQEHEIEPYVWEQSAHEVLDALAQQVIDSSIQQVLLESLLAEQAARFISMDGSTRNAKNLLETTQLAYNKARQAKITKELTELSESFI